MKLTLIDLFLDKDAMVLWCKDDQHNDRFLLDSFRPVIFFKTFNEQFARKVLRNYQVEKVRMKDLVKGEVDVLRIRFPSAVEFRRNFFRLERTLRNVGRFSNADIGMEEMYLFERGLFPFARIEAADEGKADTKEKVTALNNIDDPGLLDYPLPQLKVLKLRLEWDRQHDITSIMANEMNLKPPLLASFAKLYEWLDPDVILIEQDQQRLLKLFDDCRKEGCNVQLNRYGKDEFMLEKGSSYVSYGRTFYREAPLYLKGRLLLNTSSFIEPDFTIYSLIEGARVCRMRIQKVATHSVGATVTNLLTWQAYADDYLIPYKVGIYERIKPFRELVACDRGALTLEPYTGTHAEVAELDFVSMFPSIISTYNLSPEKLGCECCRDRKIPGTRYHFCQDGKGIVPKVCDLLMERRAYFKQQKDLVSESKASYLKWLLVVIFGFQAYRNKKIGCIEVHESINAVARETLLRAVRVAEDRGFEVVYAIVDALYVKKKTMRDNEIRELVTSIQEETGLLIEHKHTYRHITFLPSVSKPYLPVPSMFYGTTTRGEIKSRGIELRRRSSPGIVKSMQQAVLEFLQQEGSGDMRTGGSSARDPKLLFQDAVPLLANHIRALQTATPEELSIEVRVGKIDYKVNCAQKLLIDSMKQDNVDVQPGQLVSYIIEDARTGRYVESSRFRNIVDRKKYEELLKKAFLHLFSAFGVTMDDVDDAVLEMRQKRLGEYVEKEMVREVES